MSGFYLSRNTLLVSPGLEEKPPFWTPSETPGCKSPLSAILISMEFSSSFSPLLWPPKCLSIIKPIQCSIEEERGFIYSGKEGLPSFILRGEKSFFFKGRGHIPLAPLIGAAPVNLS